MIRKDSGRSKFISLLIVMTMVFSMIMPMGAWAVGSELSHNVSDSAHTFADLQVGYEVGDITPLSVQVSNNTTAAQLLVTAELSGTDAASFEITGGTIGEVSTTTPSVFSVKPILGLAEGEYNATVEIKIDGVTNTNFTVTQKILPEYATNHVGSIVTPNVLLVGEYAFTLDMTNEIYNLNNFILAAQSVENMGTKDDPEFHVYLHIGDRVWFDLVEDPNLTTPIADLDTINGDGLFTWLDDEDRTPIS